MATTVVHVRDADPKAPDVVYIGRAMPRRRLSGSMWGNPFRIGRDGTREQVIEKYRLYARDNGLIRANLSEIRGKTLACWCKPEACHGDVLAELADAPQPAPQEDR